MQPNKITNKHNKMNKMSNNNNKILIAQYS